MSADKKPVWLDDQAHTILKDFAKLLKKSATDVTSDLVVNYLHRLDEPESVETTDAPKAAAPEPSTPSVQELIADEPAPEPSRYVEAPAEVLGSSRSADTAVIPKRERKPRQDDGQVRYLGGVKFY